MMRPISEIKLITFPCQQGLILLAFPMDKVNNQNPPTQSHMYLINSRGNSSSCFGYASWTCGFPYHWETFTTTPRSCSQNLLLLICVYFFYCTHDSFKRSTCSIWTL